jgi:preprotein translocase subunit Sec61beta
MSKEERKRRRQERREQEVVDALGLLRFLESQGIEPVVTPDGRFAPAVSGDVDVAEVLQQGEQLRGFHSDLFQMHKNARERDILLEAWDRFHDEEY